MEKTSRKNPFNRIEKKAAASIAILVAVRMYGLFLIMPVFSASAGAYRGATDWLVGLAIGVYGLTQALFQVPMGLLSDFIGRKKVIVLGLCVFVAGSVIAALADTIWGVVIGRAVQGMGAIAATALALIADLSRESQRAKLMAIVGMSIGLSFMLAFVSGPHLAAWFGVSGLFWISAVLGVLSMAQLWFNVPEPEKLTAPVFHFRDLLNTLRQRELLVLDSYIFLLHAGMTALFVVLPALLVDTHNWPLSQHWKLYLPVLLASLLIMVPLLILQERNGWHRGLISVAMGALGLITAALSLAGSFAWLVLLLVLYFGLFNYLEASMPSFLSRVAQARFRGAAMGMFSTSEFLGAFCGGAGAGALLVWGAQAVYLVIGAVMLIAVLMFHRALLPRRAA